MTDWKKRIAALGFLAFFLNAGAVEIERIEPPFWWAGMKNTELQLLIYGEDIGNTIPAIDHEGVILRNVEKVSNSRYIFLNLTIASDAKPGTFSIEFLQNGKRVAETEYTLLEREEGSAERKGFGRQDVVYLLMPDRFANGDPSNDSIPGMLQGADRTNPDGRHGGDIKGIEDHLDYISGLGITALWINPLLENNNPAYSYHGYAITDFYRIDPRFGTNEAYLKLVEGCHTLGIKVINDMVFNHCSIHNWLVRDLPDKDWINSFDTYTRSNFRGSTLMDPHASEKDKQIFLTGWFDKHMADLDQRNELLANYLIQNTIWWIEYSGIDGIRVDTQPYSFPEFISEWSERVFTEYPDFNVVGEAWLQRESFTSVFQKDARLDAIPDSGIPVVTDFPLYFALASAFTENEGWTTGLARLYYVLAQDFLYGKPENKIVFCDNHDLNRYFTSMNKNVNDFLLGMTFILTTRGIPMIYYGTEILMEGYEHDGHGQIRKDFPGGWQNDTVDYFDRSQLDSITGAAQDYLVKLIKWRTKSRVAADGKLIHFIPENGVYVYFRVLDNECVMVAMNKDNSSKSIDTKRFSEYLDRYSSGFNVITGEQVDDLSGLMLAPKSAIVLQLE